MKKKLMILWLVAMVLLPSTLLYAGGGSERAAAPAAETLYDSSDWDAVMAEAKEEGTVTVYAVTSRIHAAVEEFTR